MVISVLMFTTVGSNWRAICENWLESCCGEGTVNGVASTVRLGAADAGIVWDAVAHQSPQLTVVRLPELGGVTARVLVAVLKERALGFRRPAKKSEILRAGLHALQQLTDAQLLGALDLLTPLKAGRPKKKG